MSLDNTGSFAVPVRRPATHAIRQVDGFQHQHDSPRESHLAGAKSPPSADTRVPVFMERILTLLNSIKITQQIHTDYFSVLMKKNEDALLEQVDLPDLPFSSLFAFQQFDEGLLVDAKKRRAVRDHIAIQGGDTTKEKTSRILRTILAPAVATEFSWFGAKGKKKFVDTSICKLMCTTLTDKQVSTQVTATIKEIEKAAMSWFRYAAERAAALQKKMEAEKCF
ncbi:uncharacterized protein LOC119376146 [Rhipicephalus sanguineus]|uniref:uncharacterized protein LOC119376146 n=1 Tax=Rhipicephalus sanguineus TaxID=34632 RepID=UPI0018956435|nr:uncharacterized protein LOC119376146 [Rhipicephalus sanguineus]